MVRRRFDEQLMQMHKELLEMGSLCEEIISVSVHALLHGDDSAVSMVAPLEQAINRKEGDIENLCMRLLLQQQPVARDLRQISSALKMITDLERIGDQAVRSHHTDPSSWVSKIPASSPFCTRAFPKR